MGFGRGPFGHGPFGRSNWVRQARYDVLPRVHREEDAQQGYPLRKYVDGVGTIQAEILRTIDELPNRRNPLLAHGQYDRTIPIRIGRVITTLGLKEQSGADGVVGTLREFMARTGRFSQADLGKHLTVRGSSVAANNRQVQIAAVVSPTTVLTDPPLVQDAGPLRWDLQPGVNAADGTVDVEVLTGDALRIQPGWVMDDGKSRITIVARRVFPNITTPRRPLVPLVGTDGTITAQGLFVSSSIGAAPLDYGRTLTVFSQGVLVGIYLLGTQVGGGAYRLLDMTGAAITPAEHQGALFWGLLPRTVLTLQGPSLPVGLTEQRGEDLVIASPGSTVTVTSASAEFDDARDRGKILQILYATGRRTAVVAAALSPASLSVRAQDGTSLPAGTSLGWYLHTAAPLHASQDVLDVSPPSELEHLAYDFGLRIDRQESDSRQRGWVATVATWTELKGTRTGYWAIGALSGATIEVHPLFRVSQEIGLGLPPSVLVELVERVSGRYGTDATLSSGTSGVVRMTARSGRFRASDVGRLVRLSGSGTPGNNKVYTIAGFVSSVMVEFRAGDSAVLPDNGPLQWSLLRFYSVNPPSMPSFDDFDADLMETVIDGLPATQDNWGIDRWCWDEGLEESIPITILSSAFSPPNQYLVTASGRCDVVTWAGQWKIEDSVGRSFFLESIPVVVNPATPSFSFYVSSVQPPTSGAARLVYTCQVQLSCDYCAASTVLVVVELQTTTPTAADIEEFIPRVKRRLEEVIPAHVQTIVRSTGTLEARFGFGATVEW